MTRALVSPVPRAPERPTYQWEPVRGSGTLALRLYGVLGRREIERVAEAVRERCRSPRDLVSISFEDVEHLDFRALADFTASLTRQRERGGAIWLVGLSAYLRALFQVAGQGPALARLEWNKAEAGPVLPSRRAPEGFESDRGPAREGDQSRVSL